MLLPVQMIILLGLGVVSVIIFLVFFVKSKRYDEIFTTLDEKEYPLKETYSVGYAVMETLKYDYKSQKDRTLRTQIEILYGKKYVEFYLRVIYAQKITYTMLMVVLAFIFYALTAETVVLILFLGLAGFAYIYYGESVSRKIASRKEQMIGDFAEAISKLALLTNAGLVLREAWELVAISGEGVLYDEMNRTLDDMKNGVSDAEAIRQFGVRCIIPEIKKFSSTIVQGLERGSRDLTLLMMEQSKEIWDARKQSIKREGEKASSKLMMPILLMFVGILIMVIVPVFTNLGV
ncbi:MAG: type II secretion system F family protein [Roseburia sp.]